MRATSILGSVIALYSGKSVPSAPQTAATTHTLSGISSGFNDVATTFNVTLNGQVPVGGFTTNITGAGATLSTNTLTWVFGGATSQSFTVTRTSAGSSNIAITNTGGLTDAGTPITYTTSAVLTSADWATRSTGPGVVWSHNFENDAEVTNHLLDPLSTSGVVARRAIDETGIGCLEQISLGASLASPYTAGDPTMVIDDTTYWPDPAVTGAFYFMVCRQHPLVGNKNHFLCTARAGNTLTVTYMDQTGSSAFQNATLSITDISKASEGVITSAAHGLQAGYRLHFGSVTGMSQLSYVNATIVSVTADTLTIDVDTTAYGTYVSGGAGVYFAQNYAVGDYVGWEASDWRRTFAALPAGENGKPTDDPGASGAVPLRSKLAANAYSVPRDLSIWQYGWYGHPNNQSIWANWTGWQGASPITPRGISQGVEAKYRLWDGHEFYIQWKQKLDPRFYQNHAQPDPNGETSYWGRKAMAIQSEFSSLNQLVTSVSTSNRYGIPTTTKGPVAIATHKASKILGVSDYPGRPHQSHQLGSLWDVAPHYANLSSSFKPSTGQPTPDGSTAWELPDGEWVTFLMRVKPGRSQVAETEFELKFARTEDPAYDGTYTTIMSLTDAYITYSGSGDYPYPDGVFAYPEVTTMNALPGYQAFGLMGYFNITQTVSIPPPKASYYIRMAEVIFSQAPIPAPSIVVPAWASSAASGTWNIVPMAGNLETINPINDPAINPNYPASPEWAPNSTRFSMVCDAWNGAHYNENKDEMWICYAGGHGDYAGNEILACDFRAVTPTWRMVRKPSGAIGNLLTTNDGQEATGMYSDGRPRAAHTYNKPIYIPYTGPALAVQGSTSWSGGSGLLTTVVVNETTGEHIFGSGSTPISQGDTSGGGGCWDTLREVIWFKGKGTHVMTKYTPTVSGDLSVGTWSQVGTSFNSDGGTSLCYLPDHDCILVGSGASWSPSATPWRVFDCATGILHTPTIVGSMAGGAFPGDSQPRWVPSLGAVCAWDNSTSTTLITRLTPGVDPRTDQWTIDTLPVSGSNAVTPGAANTNGTYGRFAYSPNFGGFLVFNTTSGSMYFYKI